MGERRRKRENKRIERTGKREGKRQSSGGRVLKIGHHSRWCALIDIPRTQLVKVKGRRISADNRICTITLAAHARRGLIRSLSCYL